MGIIVLLVAAMFMGLGIPMVVKGAAMLKSDEPVVITVAPASKVLPELSEEEEWSEFHADAYAECADEFTAYFNAIEFKRAKNGASMIRTPGAKSFKFVAKA